MANKKKETKKHQNMTLFPSDKERAIRLSTDIFGSPNINGLFPFLMTWYEKMHPLQPNKTDNGVL